ncbi:hypothetical protein GCM10028807_58630 [Spirosoma daeguense]
MIKGFTFFVLFLLNLVISSAGFAQATRYVRQTASGTGDGSSWANASADLQAMINNSVFNDEVRIAQGIYYPTRDQDGNLSNANPRRRTFLVPNGLRIRGGYVGTGANPNARVTAPSTTTLSGDLGVAGNFSDNSYHVVTMPNALSVILEGLIITGGNANTVVTGNGNRDLYGGGILMVNTVQTLVTPILYWVHLINNQASNGAGLANFGGGSGLNEAFPTRISNPQLTFCYFLNNRATRNGGAIYNNGNASPTINNCVFTANVAQQSGGAMSNEPASGYTLTISPVLTGCTFQSNSATISGGAIDNLSSPNVTMQPTLERCKFTSNVATPSGSGRGGAVYNRTAGGQLSLSIRNSWFYNNAADQGGAIFSLTTSTTANVGIGMVNSTLTGNSARNGGAIYQNNTSSTTDDLPSLYMLNTILWGNNATATSPGVESFGYYKPRADFSDIQGCSTQSWCTDGFRNIDVNPSLGPDNLTPGPTSYVLNIGNPYSTTADTGPADVDGAPRIQGGQIDMGAVETEVPQNRLYSVADGDWNSPAVWSCYCLPGPGITAVLQNTVRIPPNYTGYTQTLQYTSTGILRFAAPTSKLFLAPPGSL